MVASVRAATNSATMTALISGLITLLNGFTATASTLLSPVGVALSLTAAAAAWLALVEIELMDRNAAKPHVGRH